MDNTYRYKSENKMVLASAEKTFSTSTNKAEFRSFVIEAGENGQSIIMNYPKLYFKIGELDYLNLANITNDELMGIKGIKISSYPYIPVYLDEDKVKCYDIGNVSIIRSLDLSTTLRIAMRHDGKHDLKIGVNKEFMRSFPLSLLDLQNLFGEGETFSVFNK